MPSIRGTDGIRVAAFDDLDARTAYELWRLRQQVFVVEQRSPYPDLDGRDLEPTTRHLLAEADGVLVGCLRLLEDGSSLRIGRVVVAPPARGAGLARRLMEVAMGLCGGREVHLDAQTGLVGFYEGFGFEVAGAEFDEDGVRHVPMSRAATSQAQGRRSGSPRSTSGSDRPPSTSSSLPVTYLPAGEDR